MTADSAKRPNILIILADDLGFSDPGCFGGEIRTPNIDRLGYEGVRFSDFHASPACSPTRSMLMSGTSAHLAGVGTLPEFEKTMTEYQNQNSYVGHLHNSIATMPELLRDGGYHTVMAGKWHLGTTKQQSPIARGFEKAFALMVGGGNHYAWEPTVEPGEANIMVRGSIEGMYMDEDAFVDKLPDDYYSSNFFTDRLLKYLKERPADDERPFFAYLPFQAPHFPLQVDKAWVEKYRGRYDAGPEVLKEERLVRLRELGFLLQDMPAAPFYAYPQRKSNQNWKKRDDVARARSARKMECYAGLVENMDWNIGRVVAHLDATGQLDNTIVFFMSDNGAEGSILEAAPPMRNLAGGFAKYYDNSLENLGNPDSYCWYGNRWAQVGTAPSKLYKFFSHQGGIRVCSLVRYPQWLKQGTISHEYCTIMDILPTLLDVAGIPRPGTTYQGRDVEPILGRSWLDYMTGKAQHIHDDDTVTGWEFIGRQALRKGSYKIVRCPIPWGTGHWELFNLALDMAEEVDLKDEEPAKYKELVEEWGRYAKKHGIVDCKKVETAFDLQIEDLEDGLPEIPF
ncbi:hypothetical protein Sste5346_009769 [Sporothrix stenoceras]|uniref:Sulfatase N-terminal domain-containing protein n=1 Tax=Sporothrix stenoceras TaxID=5173 RepID=A0ABR3YIK5_9PEZI